MKWSDDDGSEHSRYEHIVYPAHLEHLCAAQQEGSRRQWDGDEDGCLLEERRLPWTKLQQRMASPNFRTVFQQEDADPESRLIDRYLFQLRHFTR